MYEHRQQLHPSSTLDGDTQGVAVGVVGDFGVLTKKNDDFGDASYPLSHGGHALGKTKKTIRW